ncbi:MAG: hypothetical protein K6T61_18560, partial [Bryobacteraceae bacterium]|nr:hypothetical protein [Bryobacteraceae bacterium]
PDIDQEVLFLHHERDYAQGELFLQPLQVITREAQEKAEKEKIREAMQRAKGNRVHAAKLLNISRATLYNKLKRYRLTDINPASD